MKLYYGIYYLCTGCKQKRFTRRGVLPDLCPKCRGKDIQFISLRRFDDIPDGTPLEVEIEMLAHRMMSTLNDVQDQATWLRDRYKTLQKELMDDRQHRIEKNVIFP